MMKKQRVNQSKQSFWSKWTQKWQSLSQSALAASTLNLRDLNPNGNGGIQINSNPGLLLRNVLTLTFIVAAILTLYHLIIGAIHWISSGGDKGKVEDARNQILAAIIGILILACTWAIFQLVLTVAFGTDASGLSLPTLVDGI